MLSLFHTLYFEATRNCNLNCPFCSTGSNKRRDYPDLDTKTIINRVLEPAWALGTRMVDFSGGEFLIRKDAFELLEITNTMGFRISIVSNGTTLTDKTIEKLKNLLGDNIMISLGINSFDSENKISRDYEYENTIKLINKLEKYHIPINMVVTIGKFNAHSFSDTIANIEELKLPYNRTPFCPRNSPRHDMMFDKETMKEYIHPVLRKYYKGYVSYAPFFLSPEIYEKATGQNQNNTPVPTSPSIGCWVGSFYGINAEGDVAPCPLLLDHVHGGNVLETNLSDILYKSELFSKIIHRENIKGKCKNCKYNFTCGGCRVMAYYHTGDVFGEDPTCFIEDLSENELKQLENETAKNFKNYHRMTCFGGVFKQ
jgi:radical SAM protein with 4Fe4S-binding SPASM domain